MLEKYLSRKFLVALGSILTALAGAVSGELDFTQAIAAIVAVVVAYTGVQTIEDLKKGQEGNKYLSRKFLLLVSAITATVGGVLSGEMNMVAGITAIVSAAISYLGFQGFLDSRATSGTDDGTPPA